MFPLTIPHKCFHAKFFLFFNENLWKILIYLCKLPVHNLQFSEVNLSRFFSRGLIEDSDKLFEEEKHARPVTLFFKNYSKKIEIFKGIKA